MRAAPAAPSGDQGEDVHGGFPSPMLLATRFARLRLCRVGSQQAALVPMLPIKTTAAIAQSPPPATLACTQEIPTNRSSTALPQAQGPSRSGNGCPPSAAETPTEIAAQPCVRTATDRRSEWLTALPWSVYADNSHYAEVVVLRCFAVNKKRSPVKCTVDAIVGMTFMNCHILASGHKKAQITLR